MSTRNQSRKRATERGANDYLLRIVDPTWLRPLKNETTFFTRVMTIKMLAKLSKASGVLERVDTFDLLVSLNQLWEQDPCITEYLNGIKDGHKKAKRAGLPFLDNLLAAITSSLPFKSNSIPKDCPKRDGKIPEDQTVQALEDNFLPLHKSLKQ